MPHPQLCKEECGEPHQYQEEVCCPQPQADPPGSAGHQEAPMKNPTWTGKQLKEKIPSLEGIDIRAIQRACKEKPNMSSRKMAKKPLFTQRTKNQWLPFATWSTRIGGSRSGKKLCFQMRVISSCTLVRSSPGVGCQWGRTVMFSDESHFELHLWKRSPSAGCQWGRTNQPQVHTEDREAPH
jgi:hypothetical protein